MKTGWTAWRLALVGLSPIHVVYGPALLIGESSMLPTLFGYCYRFLGTFSYPWRLSGIPYKNQLDRKDCFC